MEIRIITRASEIAQVCNLWQELFPSDPRSSHDLIELLYGIGCYGNSVVFGAWEGSALIGLLCAVGDSKESIGYIHAVGVQEERRHRGYGGSLLKECEKWCVAHAIKKMQFSGFPKQYVLPGLDDVCYPHGRAFFLRNKYSVLGEVFSMERSLQEEISVPPLHKGVTILPFSDEHFPSMLSLCIEKLHPEWALTLQIGYVRANGCMLVALYEGSVVGFSCCGIVGSDVSRFGPIGVDPAYRGKSIGKSLLFATLKKQKELGCSRSYFLWGDEGSVAVKMYTSFGFSPFRKMHIWQKEL